MLGDETVTPTFTGVTAGASGIDAGDNPATFTGATANVTVDTTGKYIITSIVNGNLKIIPVATEIILIADSASKTYDGTPLTKPTYTMAAGSPALIAGDVLEVVVTGSQTDAGSSDNVISSYVVKRGQKDVTANYTFGESVKGTLTVNPVTYTISYEYTGIVPDGAPDVPDAESVEIRNATPIQKDVAEAPTLDGYTFSGWTTTNVDVTGEKFNMPLDNVKFTGEWTIRNDLSYTVNYIWKGPDGDVAVVPAKTVNNQTFGTTITTEQETPVEASGYTIIPNQTCNLTIGTGENVINFYYYKNVEVKANSDTKTYNGQLQSVEGYTTKTVLGDETVTPTFTGVTAGAPIFLAIFFF